MKAIIPAKTNSTRVPNKNFRPFYGEVSLFDITVDKLLKVMSPSDIFMSCEDPAKQDIAEKYGINFLLEDEELTHLGVRIPHWIRSVCNQVPGDDDIAWCQVIDPLFDSYAECFEKWKKAKTKHDSLVAIYPFREYTLDAEHRPEGYGFGEWHLVSQLLPQRYCLTFTLSILSRESLKRCGYYVGMQPCWYEASNHGLDIDTLEDFEMAQCIYKYIVEREESQEKEVKKEAAYA